MGLFGVLNFQAAYLAFVLLGFSFIVHGVTPWGDMLGLAVGHTYYYFDVVLPSLAVGQGVRLLKTPDWVVRLFN